MLGRNSLDRLEALDDTSANPAFEVLSNAISKVSAGRASIPEEVANLVAFLATEAGSYIQGTALSAGGGMAD
jgi:3-oxoacyl-[acyl-carrier protein] reductase